MTKLSLLASSALAGLALAYPAIAADMPVKMPVKAVIAPSPEAWTWTGFYLGIHAGYAWADSSTSCSFLDAATSPCDTFTFPRTKGRGGLVGGEVGANWQFQNWVFGVAGDLAWLDISDSTQFPSIDFGKTDQLASRYDWLGTARGRVGLAAGRSLFYGTGGVAFGRVKHEYIHNVFNEAPGSAQTFAATDTLVGWTAGVGWEFMLNQHWTVKAEYLHVDLGTSDLNISSVASGSTLHFTNRLNLIRAGVNFKF